MSWFEFKSLLTGLGPETALGRIVQIRSEDDAEALKSFTPSMRKIHDDWMKRRAENVSKEEMETFLDGMKKMFISWGSEG